MYIFCIWKVLQVHKIWRGLPSTFTLSKFYAVFLHVTWQRFLNKLVTELKMAEKTEKANKRVIVVAMDGSKESDNALDCKYLWYFFVYIITIQIIDLLRHKRVFLCILYILHFIKLNICTYTILLHDIVNNLVRSISIDF